MRWLWVMALLWWSLPVQARWVEAESPHFIVYSDGSDANLRGFVQQLEDFDALLRDLTGTRREDAPHKLRIYLLRGSESMREIRQVTNEVGGMYIASPTGIAAFAIRRDSEDRDGLQRQQVMFHEYAHHFMQQYYPFGYPAWYVEGFAEYLMTAAFSPTQIEVGRQSLSRTGWLTYERWIPSETLLTKSPKALDANQFGLFYPQSWLTVHYINRTPGKLEALRKFLTLQGEGVPAAEAFKTAFGTDFATFDRDLRRYYDGRMTYTVFDRTPVAGRAPIVLRPLPPSADELLLSLAHLRSGVAEKAKGGRLAQVRRAAARYPGDAFAQRVLALAEAQIGDPEAAIMVADRRLAQDPKDAEALVAKATALMAQAEDAGEGKAPLLAQARQHFVRANAAAPRQAPILYAFAKARLASARPDANILEVLLTAREIAPQVPSIGMLTAYVAMHRSEFAMAEALLKPIAFNPHGGKTAEAAATMLEGARSRKVVAPPDDKTNAEDDK